MFEYCLLAIPWMVDPALVDQTDRTIVAPIATCVRPAVSVIEPGTVSALSSSDIADRQMISTILKRWERATQNTPEWSRSQHEEFRRRIQEDFNEHSAAATEQLVGHVNAKKLSDTYEWRVIERNHEHVCLSATPRDETERLFYGSLRVVLDADSGVPEQLVIIGRNQRQRLVWQNDRPAEINEIRLVRFENDVPPAPSEPLRIVNAHVD